MIEVDSRINCTGCSACANICPRGCISMQADSEGFLYPLVNADMCIDCGLCEDVCPMLHKPIQHEVLAVYGAKNKNEEVRMESSSGGMFSLFAEAVLISGGVVVGVALDGEFMPHHVMIDSVDKLDLLRGSKYVQSKIGSI